MAVGDAGERRQGRQLPCGRPRDARRIPLPSGFSSSELEIVRSSAIAYPAAADDPDQIVALGR